MTARDMIIEIINQNALNQEISIEINKHLIPDKSYKYEYFSVSDVAISGHQLILHTEVEK